MSANQNSGSSKSMVSPFQVVGDVAETAERITLPVVEAAGVVPRPKEVGQLWVETEYDALTQEQAALWASMTETRAREPGVKQAGLNLQATELTHTVAGNQLLLDEARGRYQQVQNALAPFRRRAAGSRPWYQAAKATIFVGDLAGFATAAIWLGETWPIAVTLAASAAAATVVAGLVGTEYSDMRRRKLRERDPGELTPEEKPFAHLFTQVDAGASIVRRVLLLSLVTAVMVGVGVGTLRAAVDDLLIGVVFAGIALAVAGGSFLVSYAGADEIADLINLYRLDYETQSKLHLALAADPTWKDWAENQALATSLREEVTSRGDAATHHV